MSGETFVIISYIFAKLHETSFVLKFCRRFYFLGAIFGAGAGCVCECACSQNKRGAGAGAGAVII